MLREEIFRGRMDETGGEKEKVSGELLFASSSVLHQTHSPAVKENCK